MLIMNVVVGMPAAIMMMPVVVVVMSVPITGLLVMCGERHCGYRLD
jgi:hypothetical protein